jgi:S1-C subfamily serine protease
VNHVASTSTEAGDPARGSTDRFSFSTILVTLNLALIIALGGYAVLGDWSVSTTGKGPAPKPQPVPDQGRALQPGHAAAGGQVLPISLPQPAHRLPAPGPAPAPAPAEPGSLTTREIVARTEASVALIKGRLGSGSGFLARSGVVITNAHVIELELLGALEVHFPSAAEGAKGPYRVRLLDKKPGRDLAMLAVESSLPALPLATSYKFRKGEDVTIIGTPGLGGGMILQNAVAHGILSTETVLDGQNYYQLGASVNAGNSGGPALDSSGEVIGVVTSKARGREAIGFCIPVGDVARALVRMDHLERGDQARLERIHNVEALARCLHALGSLHLEVLDQYVAAMEASRARGGTANAGIRAAAGANRDRLAAWRSAFMAGMETEMNAVVRNLELPVHLRRDLGELRALTRTMQDHVDRPQGNFQSFSAQVAIMKNQFNLCVDRLMRELEIRFED